MKHPLSCRVASALLLLVGAACGEIPTARSTVGGSGGGGSGGPPLGGGPGGAGGSGGVAQDAGAVGGLADAAAPDTAVDTVPAPGPSTQGPVAGGRIVYSQDFESGMDGITRSPTNLPADRAAIADDPLGQRGKVMKIVWKAGDDFQTNGGSTHTRSFISNTGYAFASGSTVEYAWGYMTANQEINAAFGQHIRPGGPMWLIEGTADGQTYVNCRSCGGKANLPVRIEPNRWYDIRVEMTYASGGPIRFFVDGVMVLERRMSVNDPAGSKAHWDGGIYNHAEGVTTRTVYISNLSVGLK
jgi:hypothetical protein